MKEGLTNIKEILLKRIAIKYDLNLLVLFGSRAKNSHKKGSDYDLAFLPKYDFSINDEISLFDDLGDIFKEEPFDLVNLEKNHSVVLKQQIFQYGYLIYENKEYLFEKEKEFAFFDYIDSIALLRPNKEAFMSNPL